MSQYKKYPRTPHLPWSLSVSSDDVRVINTDHFRDQTIVVTEKMDGENTTLYADHLHARSLDSRHHASRDWLKQWHATIAHDIPKGWRICGENLYAQHSVAYSALKSYFYGFSLWDNSNTCMSWDETLEWFDLLNIHTPPVLYRGIWDEAVLRALHIDTQTMEGYVVRRAERFSYQHFNQNVAKWVRKNHVQTDTHWMFANIVPNGLAECTEEEEPS